MISSDSFYSSFHTIFIYPRRKQHVHAHKIAAPSADAHLRRGGGVDQAVFNRFIKHGAVVERFGRIIRPSVAMGVKMQEAQRFAVFFGMRLQQRIGDEMVAAEGEHFGMAVLNDVQRVLLDGFAYGPRLVRVKPAIAVVDHRQIVKRSKAPRKKIQFGQLHAGSANRRQPRRAPGRNVVAKSNGTPDTTTSASLKSRV